MGKVTAVLILSLILFVAILFLANELTSKETHRLQAEAYRIEAEGRARSMILEAQGQARLDSAQAMIPILAVIVLGLFGFAGLVLIGVLGIIFVSYLFKLRDNHQPPQQTIYILPRGAHYPTLTDRPYFLAEGERNYVERIQR